MDEKHKNRIFNNLRLHYIAIISKIIVSTVNMMSTLIFLVVIQLIMTPLFIIVISLDNEQEVRSLVIFFVVSVTIATFAGTWGVFLLIRSGVRYFRSQLRIATLETQIEQEKRHLELIQSLLEGQRPDVKQGTQS